MAINFDLDQLLETLIDLPVGTLAVIKLFNEDDPKEPDADDKDDPYDIFDPSQFAVASGSSGGGDFLQMESGSSSSSISGLPPA